MKILITVICFVFLAISVNCQELKPIILKAHSPSKGTNIMVALESRASHQEFDSTMLNIQDLSDLLWAANGINRPESGKRTAPSALNAQDIDIYLCTKDAIYLYNPKANLLNPIVKGDYRNLAADKQEWVKDAPVIILLISDMTKFSVKDEYKKMELAAIDAGIVSQNIGLFCSATGLFTRVRASMDIVKLTEVLKLATTQKLLLNLPVAYPKK
jgi:SagB-type dehydrogenase family enzyme